MSKIDVRCFKAYDVRGIVGEEFNEEIAYRVGRAYAELFQPKKVVIGRDVRPSGAGPGGGAGLGPDRCRRRRARHRPVRHRAGVLRHVHLALDGGIMVTASHNPPEYNGMKFVREEARAHQRRQRPAGDRSARSRAATSRAARPRRARPSTRVDMHGRVHRAPADATWTRARCKPLKIACNPGNGCAGPVLERLAPRLPFSFVKVHARARRHFPQRRAQPDAAGEPRGHVGAGAGAAPTSASPGTATSTAASSSTRRASSSKATTSSACSPRRCCKSTRARAIVHDPRLTWNTDRHRRSAAAAVPCSARRATRSSRRTCARRTRAYGGEMSAHHYFRDFCYCDSGMIPWLLVAQLLSENGGRCRSWSPSASRATPSAARSTGGWRTPTARSARIEARYGRAGARRRPHRRPQHGI